MSQLLHGVKPLCVMNTLFGKPSICYNGVVDRFLIREEVISQRATRVSSLSNNAIQQLQTSPDLFEGLLSISTAPSPDMRKPIH